MLALFAQETTEDVERVIVDFDKLSPVASVCLIIAVLIYTSLMAWLFTRIITRSTNLPRSHTLISALALLTFVALMASILTSDSSLETIAATGVGAIAGAVSNTVLTARDMKKETQREREAIPDEVNQEDQRDVP